MTENSTWIINTRGTIYQQLDHLELAPAVVLHGEGEQGGGQAAVGVVTRQKGGHLPADHPHTNLSRSAGERDLLNNFWQKQRTHDGAQWDERRNRQLQAVGAARQN